MAVARELGASPAATAIAWLLHQPSVTSPILGARTANQLRETLAADSLTLSTEQLAALDAPPQWEDVVTRPPGLPPRRG